MQFKDIIGQGKIKENLMTLYKSGRLPHALMFLGKEGVGGLPLAIAFVQYIFCENKKDNDACGKCISCRKMEKLVHPDLHLSFPTVGKKPNLSNNQLPEFRKFFSQQPYAGAYDWLQFINAGNKQGNITAEECREIISQMHLTTFEAEMKIQIIWRPEYLGKEGNILLKLIEEPPENTLLFLVAEQEEKILNTILSRTQKIMLTPLSPKQIASALKKQKNVEGKKALQIARISDNSFGRALSLLQNAGENDWLPDLRDWFNAIFTNNTIRTHQWVDKMAKEGRERQKSFLQFAQEILANVVRMHFMADFQAPLSAEELTFAKKVLQRNIPVFVIEKMTHVLQNTIYHIERNAHGKTQLLYLTLQMQYLAKGRELSIA